jgi:sulfite reductase (NADPH) hemoprotein beta-component
MVAPASNERTTSAIVARTAYLTSTSLVDLRPLTLTRSPFAAEWKSLAKSAPKNILANQSRPNTLSLPDNTDPIQLLLNNFKADDDDDDSLTTVLALANPLLTSRLLPSLPALIAASKPVVIHLAIQHGDLTPVLVLKSAVPFVLHSSTPQKAHDNALLAARLAKSTGKVVLHIFYATSPSGSKVEETSEDKVKAFIHEVQTWDLSRSPSPQLQVSKANGTNGTANGYANGSATANGNGSAIPNGVSLDNSDASSEDSYESGPNIDSHGTKVDTPLADAYLAAAMSTVALLRRPMKPFTLSPHHHHTASRLVVRLSSPLPLSSAPPEDTTIVDLSLISPFPSSQLATLLTPFVKEVIVLEQVWEWKMRWTPLFIDFATLIQSLEGQERPKLRRGIIGKFEAPLTGSQLSDLFSKQTSSPSLTIGSIPPPTSSSPELTPPQIPSHESSYFKVLQHVFGSRLEISNAPELVSSLQNPAATSPEFAVGRVKVAEQERKSVEKAIEEALRSRELEGELHELLSRWRSSPVEKSEGNVGAKIVKILESSPSLPALAKLQSFKHHFPAPPSRWIINSNSWSYDLGLGGIHAALASRLNVNLLILDTLPYTERYAQDPEKRKKDIGLYAMNYGGVYVASVALYGSYRGVLEALMEAEKWDGPSVVLAYLPYSEGEGTSALDILKETKLAIDSGYWPLYRYDPAKEARGEDPLSLDSDPIKTELQEFIDRSNHLSQLVRSTPSFATELVGGLGKHLEEARKKKAREAYESLLGGMDGPSILVLFASDGGNAEKIAKRLVGRAKARGVGARIQSFDSYGFTKLAEGGDVEDEYVIFITSTAGQGEPPQNGRDTFKALNATFLRGEKPFETTKLKYTVFGLGDSHYWPRPEDAGYYNKPGRDLDGRLAALGGERIADIGLGDDQDADGPETGYREWEVRVWKALGVDHVQILEKEPEAITNENIKIASNFLRGTIREGLADTTTGALAPSDGQLTKFHGIYEQDDRDIRDERKDAGLEPAYSFMIRCRLPGGVCTPAQWLAIDQIADEHGNSTFKLTTRQTFQFHGVIKKHLKEAVRDINRALMDTIAACGDVNR